MVTTCGECRFWRSGYVLQGAKVPAFCDRHFANRRKHDPICAEFSPSAPRSIQHPPYSHPGDAA